MRSRPLKSRRTDCCNSGRGSEDIANWHFHSSVGDQVGHHPFRAADRGRLHGMAGAQGRGAHAESVGTHAGGAVRAAATCRGWAEVFVQGGSHAAARLQAAFPGGADDGRDLCADFDFGDSVRQFDHAFWI